MGSEKNFFSNFSYSAWFSGDFQKKYPAASMEETLAALESNPSVDAAMAFFWQVFEDPNLSQLDVPQEELIRLLTQYETQQADFRNRVLSGTARLNRLSGLVDRLMPSAAPDERLDERDVVVFAHVSAALALALETLEGAQTGRYWEVVENILRSLQRSSGSWVSWFLTTPFDLEVAVSFDLVEAFLLSCLFQKHALDGQYEQALESLKKASEACANADQELIDEEEFDRIDDLIGPDIITEDAIKGRCAGYQLVAHLVPAQKAVDAFDGLLAASPNKTDWRHVAAECYFVETIWEEPTPDEEVVSNSSPIPQSARDFWLIARGLALQKLSRDDYRRLRE